MTLYLRVWEVIGVGVELCVNNADCLQVSLFACDEITLIVDACVMRALRLGICCSVCH